MDNEELEQALIAYVSRPNYQPVKPKVIAKKLGLGPSSKKHLLRVLRRLARKGHLIYGSNHLVIGPKSNQSNALQGTFRRRAGGGGKVRIPSSSSNTETEMEIYISAQDAGDAASGDFVEVTLLGKNRGRRDEFVGQIVKVLERKTDQFVGNFFEEDGEGFVQLDGKQFHRPIWVGDARSRNVETGDQVVIEMIRFPARGQPGEGVITKVLGSWELPGVETESIIHQYDLNDQFPEEVLQEAREIAQNFTGEITEDRLDLTEETILTIDPKDARDFDDAISLKRIENGHWLLGVHIADVSHWVQPRSAIDREAQERGTSVYLPGRVIPMLPEIISNGLASLQPNQVRYAMTVFIEFTEQGAPVEANYHKSAIKSKRRFTYEEVDEFNQDPESWQEKLPEDIHRLLSDMRVLAKALRARRRDAGALVLTLAEVRVDLDREGRVIGAKKVEQTESHQMIEEFMLSANEAIARVFDQKSIPFLRRVHPTPDLGKLELLHEFVVDLGLSPQNLTNRFELQSLIESIEGEPEEQAVNYAVLRSLPQAIYSPAEEGHFALASECYCHFTSPIRRYPDLIIHRMLTDLIAGKRPKSDFQQLTLLGQHCSDTERRAEQAERELNKLKLLHYFNDRTGEEMDAVITGVHSYGFFAQGIDLPVEGLVPLENLKNDRYYYDRKTHTLTGYQEENRFRLGDRVRVAVQRVDISTRELDFNLLSATPRENPLRPPPKRKGKGGPAGRASKGNRKPHWKQKRRKR
ncbi:Ribonuclease R [Planctomycetales bacterium 10988]|nr:Ribonuclease R [Planctomycetales bacterium 10988]